MKSDFGSWIAAHITGEALLSKVTRVVAHPTHDEIARLAYARYLARGANGGDAVADWLSAERELVRHAR